MTIAMRLQLPVCLRNQHANLPALGHHMIKGFMVHARRSHQPPRRSGQPAHQAPTALFERPSRRTILRTNTHCRPLSIKRSQPVPAVKTALDLQLDASWDVANILSTELTQIPSNGHDKARNGMGIPVLNLISTQMLIGA